MMVEGPRRRKCPLSRSEPVRSTDEYGRIAVIDCVDFARPEYTLDNRGFTNDRRAAPRFI
jgi:hypothetical protein